MMESTLLEMQLRNMHLPTILANYRRLLGEHAEPLPYLSDLISLESAKRQENGVRTRIAAAHFPTIKTIESFDFTLQPELPKAKLLEHFEGAFVEAQRNVILVARRESGRAIFWAHLDSRCACAAIAYFSPRLLRS